MCGIVPILWGGYPDFANPLRGGGMPGFWQFSKGGYSDYANHLRRGGNPDPAGGWGCPDSANPQSGVPWFHQWKSKSFHPSNIFWMVSYYITVQYKAAILWMIKGQNDKYDTSIYR